MIKYEKILPSVLYCTVLYCSIDVLCCDCCKKLCGKSGEGGGKEDKSKWLEIDPKTGEEVIPFDIQKKWTFFLKEKAEWENMWKQSLGEEKLGDGDAVPVLFNASCNDKKVFCGEDMPGNKRAGSTVFAFSKNYTFDDILKYLQTNDKIKNIVLSCEVDNVTILYDGSQNDVAVMKIVDVFTAFKNAKDPFLQRVVCLSFTYDVVSKDV